MVESGERFIFNDRKGMQGKNQIFTKCGAVVEVNEYYPFGLVNQQTSSKQFGSKENLVKYNGKELMNDFKLESYDYGARMYNPQIGRWQVTDKMAQKYARMSPYNYTLNNPIKFVDPDGNDVKDVIVTGPQAKQAVSELNKNSSLKITRDEKTGQLSASGKATTKGDQKLLEAINDKNITVELRTTDKNLIDSKDGTKNVALTPAAFEGSTINPDKTVDALQIVNVDNAAKVAGVIGESTGATLTHEINEAYFGAVQTPGGDYNTAYTKAHNSASALDKVNTNHSNFDINDDKKRNMIQIRKSGTQTWIDLGPKTK
ncbi:MAG: RHS repeat domain-containing protein [Waterburya sp.]